MLLLAAVNGSNDVPDRRGNLMYAAADYMTVESLARLLQHAGAVKAVQFDINPEWPSLNTYRHDPLLVPDDRDFFAVYRRLPGQPATVPFS